jgi:lysozyme
MNMNEILAILIPLLKEFEGCKLKAYKCPAGIWTIGYGCTGAEVCEGLTWSQANADQHLLQRAIDAISQLLDASPILHNENPERIAALASFVYNLGIGNYNKSSLKFRVNQNDWIAAQTEIKKWNKAGGVALSGLTKRRAKEAELLS